MTKSDPNYYVAGIQKSLKVANENGITAMCRFHGFGKNTTVSIQFTAVATGEKASLYFEKE